MAHRDKRTIIDISQDPGLSKNKIVQKFTDSKKYVTSKKFHWVPDKPDKRDYKYQVTTKVQKDIVDLRNFCSPVENQLQLGSCTGQAIAGAIELLNNKTGRYKDISRLFIYYYERLMLNTVNFDSGAYIRDGIKVTNKQGAPLENLWPYDITQFKVKPNRMAINDALQRKVSLYERIANHAGCLDALNNGYPIIVGFKVYSSFIKGDVKTTGIMPYPDTSRESLVGGHAVLLVGYNKLTKTYIARNSWGSEWGDKGYFYMPFKVIENTKMSSDFWIIKAVRNP